ncbi:short-chain dehydrogenase/reductase [Mycolicibacillus koreensis]|uniref:Short-chain dehydrogenase n=1 Tax=Mycolicibacillus koreensis TaxID=1069220 RepID=A0AA91ST13_9MYCO|nr:short-chain dehydrogenase/reductase [Mycolicibacillus koreensis]OSC35422.1 short-chain dehydrogenase [Mycolicibacillus koreensis]
MRRTQAARIAGKTVMVTGGARGIGAQVARDLVARGARVAILDRDVAAAAHLAGELGSAAAAFNADVTSAESMITACASSVEHFGGLDAVVANAGIAGPGATVAAVDPERWRNVIDVNLTGVFHTAHAALPHLRARRGYLLAVASVAAVLPGPTVSGYMAAKSGVESLVRSLRVELGGTGVGVGIAYFGLVDTGLAADLLADSGLGAVMSAVPAVVGKPIPVAAAATAIAAGVARRSRRVYAPRWVGPLVSLRTPLSSADRLLAVWPGIRRTVGNADRVGDRT